MDKLVDSAVSLVEEGRLQQAVEVLQQGITLLSSTYPGSPELSELHNQAALLLLFGHQHDAAAKHASDALEITQKAFGPTHPLTGHRLLRLGTIRFAAGELDDARPLLATAADMLSTQLGDPSQAEALYYMGLYNLVSAEGPSAVVAATAPLKENLRQLVSALGPDSMIVRLALAAHSKLVGAMLDMGLQHGEAAFKQHITLQEVQDPESAELGLTLYQLATTYYAHDMLQDAGPVLQRATQLMRSHYPEEHDLMVLCKHRMGMICAAGRDHKAATALLTSSKEHYQKQQQDHPLALEADLGLTMAQLKALSPRLSSSERSTAVDEALEQMRRTLTGMAGALGADHLLVTAGTRYMAQLSVMLGQRQ